MAGLILTPGFASGLQTPGHARLVESSPEWIPATDETKADASFKGRGFSFIPIRAAHIDYIAAVMGREPPDFERMAGNCMVNRDYLPLGFCFAYFADDDIVEAHAYFGDWLRIFPKDILRSMHDFMGVLRDRCDVTIVYASADKTIEGSETLIRWFKGEETGEYDEFGSPIYRIDITRTKI